MAGCRLPWDPTLKIVGAQLRLTSSGVACGTLLGSTLVWSWCVCLALLPSVLPVLSCAQYAPDEGYQVGPKRSAILNFGKLRLRPRENRHLLRLDARPARNRHFHGK